MEALPALATGVVLAASAGLRAFLPVFSAGLAVRLLGVPLPAYLAWLDDTAALVLFGAATLLEVLGDKVPVVDHALDAVQTLTKPLLAALAATPFLYQLAPEYAVAFGLILGAPLALTVHSAKATARVGSTTATGGMGNPVLSVVEDGAAVGAIVLVFLAPLLALALTAALVYALLRLAGRARRHARGRPAPLR